jgi:hypothetical protein
MVAAKRMNFVEHMCGFEWLQCYRQRGQVIEESLNKRRRDAFSPLPDEQSAQYLVRPEGRNDGCRALFEEVGDSLGLRGMLVRKTPH